MPARRKSVHGVFDLLKLPIPMGKTNAIPEDSKPKLAEAVKFLDGFIERSGGFVAGDRITIADHAIVAIMSSLEVSGMFP